MAAQLSEDQLNQLLQSLGFVGGAAESAARSLARSANASDSVTSAAVREAEARASLLQQTNTVKDAFKRLGGDVVKFTTSIINTADSVAGSGGVFTSVTPVITFFAETVQSLTKILPTALGWLGTGIGTMLGGPVGAGIGATIGKGLGKVIDGTLGELAPIMATIANQYLQQGEKVIQAFNGLSTVGITFGGSLENMHKMIANTNMPLEMLAKIAQQNAENLALFGGGTVGALERVAKVARNDLGPQLVTLHGGFANLTDELVDYLAMEQRRGVSENLLSAENIETTKSYLYMLKEVSALTGKSAKQLRAEIEERSRNAAMQSMYSKMSAQEKENFDKGFATMPDIAKEALKDVVLAQSMGMEPLSERFRYLSATMPDLANSIRRTASGIKKGPEEFNAILGKESANMAKLAKGYTKDFSPLLYYKEAGLINSKVVDVISDTLTAINANETRLKSVEEDIKTFAQQTKELKENTGGFVQSVKDIYDAQSNMARSLNELIIGNKDTPSKFNEFASLSVKATNLMESIVRNLDKIVTKIVNNSSENQVFDQRDKVIDAKQRLAALDEIRANLLRPYVESTTESIPYNMPLPEGLDQNTRLRIQHIDQAIKRQEQRLQDTEKGLKDAVRENEESKAREQEEKIQDELDKARENAPTMLRGQPISDASTNNTIVSYIESQSQLLVELRDSLKDQGKDFRKAARMIA